MQNLFLRYYFLRSPCGVVNFNTSPMPPPSKEFSLDALNSEQTPTVQKAVDQAGQKPVDRQVNRYRF